MIPFKKLTLAAAVGGLLLGSAAADAAQVAYSMYDLYAGNKHRVADLPVNDSTAGRSSNPSHDNYGAPNDWRTADGSVVTSPNYGWTQGGGLPAAWWVTLGGTDSASVNSADFVSARQAGGFLGGTGGNPAEYIGIQPTALTVGSGAFYDGSSNWGHNSDFGLFTLETAADVIIEVSGVTDPADLVGAGVLNLRPGFAVWQGWDSAGGTRHTTYAPTGYMVPGGNNPVFPGAVSMTLEGVARPDDNLGSFVGSAWNLTAGGTATLTLTDLPAGDYYIALGGITHTAAGAPPVPGLGGLTRQYSVSFSSSAPAAPVPIPAAVWLFGSALAGLGVIGRRRNTPDA